MYRIDRDNDDTSYSTFFNLRPLCFLELEFVQSIIGIRGAAWHVCAVIHVASGRSRNYCTTDQCISGLASRRRQCTWQIAIGVDHRPSPRSRCRNTSLFAPRQPPTFVPTYIHSSYTLQVYDFYPQRNNTIKSDGTSQARDYHGAHQTSQPFARRYNQSLEFIHWYHRCRPHRRFCACHFIVQSHVR